MGSANAGISRTNHTVWLPVSFGFMKLPLRVSRWTHYTAANGSERTGPVVVLIHGLCGDRRNLHLVGSHVVRELRGEAWSVSLGGHELSSMPLTFDDLVRMVIVAMEQLGVPKDAIVVGQSLGGMVGVRAAQLTDWFYHAIAIDSPVRAAHRKMGYPRLVSGLSILAVDVTASVLPALWDARQHGNLRPHLRSLAGMVFPPPRLAFAPLHTLVLVRKGVRQATAALAALEDKGVGWDLVEGALDIALRGASHEPVTVIARVGHAAPQFQHGADAVIHLIVQAHDSHHRMAATAA